MNEYLIINNNEQFIESNNEDDNKNILINMGFEASLVTTIFNNIHPIDIDEALAYLNKNDNGLFTHSYIVNERFVCAICGKGRGAHQNEAYFLETTNNNNSFEDEDNNLFTNNLLNRDNISNRSNRYESSYLFGKLNLEDSFEINKTCGICEEIIEFEEANKIKIKCNHLFCTDCWFNYLKEKINNSNVAKISCMQSGCGIILDSNFIKKILGNNLDLINKYDKFLEKQQILQSNKNYKFCPVPDCDGFAEKKKNIKYVKCNFGHEFCFNCLNKPHGIKKCSDIVDKEFEKWKSKKIVKRCPKCKIWTEKNEGCNHMTCVECKFQWCWLCKKEYKLGHYYQGSCRGLQFEKEEDEEKIKKLMENNLKNPHIRNINNNDLNLLININNRNIRNNNNCCICFYYSLILYTIVKFLITFILYLFYNIAKESFYLIKFIFLFPYIFMSSNAFEYLNMNVLLYISFLLFIPFFICFSILSLSLFIIVCIPCIYNTAYRNMINRFYFKYNNSLPYSLITINEIDD